MILTEDFVVTAPQLEPFIPIELISCPVCGTAAVDWRTRIWARLIGRAPQIVSVSYCSGGRAPVEDVSNPIEAIMRGSSESRPRCGGIVEPHLHLKCNCCGYIRLMRTKA